MQFDTRCVLEDHTDTDMAASKLMHAYSITKNPAHVLPLYVFEDSIPHPHIPSMVHLGSYLLTKTQYYFILNNIDTILFVTYEQRHNII